MSFGRLSCLFLFYKSFIYGGLETGCAAVAVISGYTRIVDNGVSFGSSYVPLSSELRRWRNVWQRTRFGWNKWFEVYRRDELIHSLALGYVERILGFGSVRDLIPYVYELSVVASRVEGRGGDPRALASAIIYYVEVWRAALEKRSPRLRLRDLFVFSSRPSVYRALRILVRRLGHSDVFYRLLLSRQLRLCDYSLYGDRIYVRSGLVVVRGPGPMVLDERIVRGVYRIPKNGSVEVYCLPNSSMFMGDRCMATVELKMRFRVLELLEFLRKRLGESFTAKDVADILATDSRYAGRLLLLLESRGYLEIVEEKPVRKYRIRDR